MPKTKEQTPEEQLLNAILSDPTMASVKRDFSNKQLFNNTDDLSACNDKLICVASVLAIHFPFYTIQHFIETKSQSVGKNLIHDQKEKDALKNVKSELIECCRFNCILQLMADKSTREAHYDNLPRRKKPLLLNLVQTAPKEEQLDLIKQLQDEYGVPADIFPKNYKELTNKINAVTRRNTEKKLPFTNHTELVTQGERMSQGIIDHHIQETKNFIKTL